MNWEALGAIAEALGAAGVIATLGYLAVQIRANTSAIRAEARRTNVGNTVISAAIIGSTKEAASVLRHGLSDPRSLDPDERLQFSFVLTTIVAPIGSSFEEFELGIIDKATFESIAQQALQLLKTPGGREYWKTFAPTYTAAFRTYVDLEIGPAGRDASPAV